jgi:hypothetical protein
MSSSKSRASTSGANDNLPEQKKEWFERLPWTTFFVIIIFLIKDKSFFLYSIISSWEDAG